MAERVSAIQATSTIPWAVTIFRTSCRSKSFSRQSASQAFGEKKKRPALQVV
jgi:hypothetical protein